MHCRPTFECTLSPSIVDPLAGEEVSEGSTLDAAGKLALIGKRAPAKCYTVAFDRERDQRNCDAIFRNQHVVERYAARGGMKWIVKQIDLHSLDFRKDYRTHGCIAAIGSRWVNFAIHHLRCLYPESWIEKRVDQLFEDLISKIYNRLPENSDVPSFTEVDQSQETWTQRLKEVVAETQKLSGEGLDREALRWRLDAYKVAVLEFRDISIRSGRSFQDLYEDRLVATIEMLDLNNSNLHADSLSQRRAFRNIIKDETISKFADKKLWLQKIHKQFYFEGSSDREVRFPEYLNAVIEAEQYAQKTDPQTVEQLLKIRKERAAFLDTMKTDQEYLRLKSELSRIAPDSEGQERLLQVAYSVTVKDNPDSGHFSQYFKGCLQAVLTVARNKTQPVQDYVNTEQFFESVRWAHSAAIIRAIVRDTPEMQQEIDNQLKQEGLADLPVLKSKITGYVCYRVAFAILKGEDRKQLRSLFSDFLLATIQQAAITEDYQSSAHYGDPFWDAVSESYTKIKQQR